MDKKRNIPSVFPGGRDIAGAVPGMTKDIVESRAIAREQQAANQQKEHIKKQIQEKQVRALRNQYRGGAGGLLGEAPRGVSLGESTGLPTKLGAA